MGDRTLWLAPPLLLLFLPGLSAIRGPKAVSGLERGSLTAQCRYGQGWETYKKWWCRGADWNLCRILVKTTGSEQMVKQGRVSIMDNQRDRVFTVTMEELRQDDADTYWCGIERPGVDLGDTVKVTIDPAPVTPEETQVSPTVTSHPSNSRSLLSSVHFLLLVFLEVPLLLSMLGAVLWVNRPQRNSGGMQSQLGHENQ
ncbi:CMRF35-like molecule 5 isoform X2 [Diceros bicornis minor]|uniref:CMRF35-like molecule 5 isoform X2 n=1 Tax=Diceros bicornis minor TaxID=77932 RepID=UPI0026F1AD4E|nr:CMRF35-like molecule 5 isoform X2 [Diceros bicornis minor]